MTNEHPTASTPTCLEVLNAAVGAIGGDLRPGQQQMALAVDETLRNAGQLLVQAGTGTGKSLGYLAPALAWTHETGERVIVATATLALQNQLATKDIPAALDAAEKAFGNRPKVAVVKGRSNYACLLKTREGTVHEDQAALIGAIEIAQTVAASGGNAETLLGAEVLALREWAEAQADEQGSGERDDAPIHNPKAWAQVSVGARECVGAGKCPFADECFVERSRAIARAADLVVTNHTLLAIDAIQATKTLPERGGIIIDEAHDLVDRVTGAASAELSPQQVERALRQVVALITDNDLADDLAGAVALFVRALDLCDPGRIGQGEQTLLEGLLLLSEAFKRAETAVQPGKGDVDNDEMLTRTSATVACSDIDLVAARMAALDESDVVWVSERPTFGKQLVVAPLDVASVMQDKVFADVAVVLTSATLKVGGKFEPLARKFGFGVATSTSDPDSGHVFGVVSDDPGWHGLDVGSPFDYPRQGICYFGRDLPPPGRDGISEEVLAEIAQLVWAAGGRTLGLFASQRNAEAAAAYCRKELGELPVLCQGEAQLPELTKRFVAEPKTSLFGTLSLWQGVDVPGETCRLVIIDKIPFPRPDDPLMQARQQAVADAGGNGFMQVASTHAGLLLAQGAGRLIRRHTDRGVVAVLDPRIVTARYGSFLRASLPPFWTTTDLDDAVEALRRLAESDER